MLKYKIDVLEAMKEKGYTSYKIRKEKLIDEAQLTKIRSGEIASKETLNIKQYIHLFPVLIMHKKQVYFFAIFHIYTHFKSMIISSPNNKAP